MSVDTLARPGLRQRPAAIPRRRLALEQLGVLGGQAAAGVGNLAFSLAMARLLAPGSFAALASFGALYLLLTMPAASLTAGSALDPAFAARLHRRVMLAGGGLALVGAAAAVPAGRLLGLSPLLVALLALAAPGAGPLALARGRLYAARRHGGLVSSLLVEPAGRIALGSVLAPVAGAAGAAAAIVLAGYLALAVAVRAGKGTLATRREGVRGGGVVAAFVVLAMLQNQDVVLANAVLGRHAAGLFAVVSTLGGIAAFATVTVPMVLLARARGGGREPFGVAVLIAAAVGTATVAAFAVAPATLARALFGARYADAGGIGIAYLLAMGLLGVARVFAAHLAGRGRGRTATALLAGPALVQLVLVATRVHSPEGVAEATLAATSLAAAATGTAAALELPALRAAPARALGALRTPAAVAVAGLALGALGLRLLVTRGLWIDEASSVAQAQMTFHGMLHNLRVTDVHPPLYFALLWVDVHTLGSGQLALRVPSIVAGVLLVPALYLAGRELYDRRAGLAAAGLAVVAPQAVWYAQEVRMYALFMLFAVLAVWGQARVLRRGGARDWTLYTAAAVALAWTQYFGLVLIAVQQGVFALAVWRRPADRRRLVRDWALAVGAGCVLLAPLVPFAAHQFLVNQTSGRGFGSTPAQAGHIAGEGPPSLYGFLANAVWALWGYHADATMVDLVALWPLVMLLALFLLGRGWSRASTFVAAVALLPALVLFAVGEEKPDLFDLRYFIASVPLLLLLAGRGFTVCSRSVAARVALAAVFAVSLLAGLVDQQANSDNPRRYDFGGAVHAIEARARPGDVVLYNPIYLAQVVHYYGPDLRLQPIGGTVPTHAQASRVFVIGSFFDHRAIAAATGRTLYDLGRTRRLAFRMHTSNVRVWEFR